MQLGPKGRALIQSFEKLSLVAYPDNGGVPTIGWGHTGAEVRLGQTCTPEQAQKWFDGDVTWAVKGVLRTVDVPLTQNQFDALVSFTFNVGVGNEAHSSLVRLINQRHPAAADEFGRWVHINGQVSDGLVRRRAAERALFVAPDEVPAPAPH